MLPNFAYSCALALYMEAPGKDIRSICNITVYDIIECQFWDSVRGCERLPCVHPTVQEKHMMERIGPFKHTHTHTQTHTQPQKNNNNDMCVCLNEVYDNKIKYSYDYISDIYLLRALLLFPSFPSLLLHLTSTNLTSSPTGSAYNNVPWSTLLSSVPFSSASRSSDDIVSLLVKCYALRSLDLWKGEHTYKWIHSACAHLFKLAKNTDNLRMLQSYVNHYTHNRVCIPLEVLRKAPPPSTAEFSKENILPKWILNAVGHTHTHTHTHNLDWNACVCLLRVIPLLYFYRQCSLGMISTLKG
eukprot:GHVR01128927.1.p1 GENE.GHVR01128927.1~~GHVR01128927.1.p1  ORF type:complete len:300 (+),score=92.00 GHVR01128927.1:222-1121(+)